MPLFVCDKCNGVDNTGCGCYWRSHRHDAWFEGIPANFVMCEMCMPTHFISGAKTKKSDNPTIIGYYYENPDLEVINPIDEEKYVGTFVCDNCDHLENTSLGLWHTRWANERKFGLPNGLALCSLCAPTRFLNGEPVSKWGKWHNRFVRRAYSDYPNVPVLNRPKSPNMPEWELGKIPIPKTT